eukprot:1508572-Rhodomonas_salina.2
MTHLGQEHASGPGPDRIWENAENRNVVLVANLLAYCPKTECVRPYNHLPLLRFQSRCNFVFRNATPPRERAESSTRYPGRWPLAPSSPAKLAHASIV